MKCDVELLVFCGFEAAEVGALRDGEFGEGFVVFHFGDFFIDDEDFLEEGLVDEAALVVVSSAVEVAGVLEKCDRGFEVGDAFAEVVGDVFEPLGDPSALIAVLVDVVADRVSRECAVGGKIEEASLLAVDGGEFLFEFIAEPNRRGLLVRDGACERFSEGAGEGWCEAKGAVVGGDGVFDAVDGGVPARAGILTASLVTAEEVHVNPSSACSALQNHAAFFVYAVADSAVEGALEVVGVLATAFVDEFSRGDDLLDFVENGLAHEGGVSTGNLLPVVGHVAEIVRVAQEPANLLGHELGWLISAGRSGAETSVVEFVGEVLEAVVACCIQFERKGYVVGSFRVGSYGAHFAVFEAFSDVDIADWGAGDCAAALCLFSEFVADVCTVFVGAVLVE